ncbi:hypothetical protein ACFLYO_11055 [Chloroflexota bacterium]
MDYDGQAGWIVDSASRIGGVCDELLVAQYWNCTGNIYNCGDFSTCDEVTSYFNACPGDPSRLDPNQDGTACASLCAQ